MDAVTKSKNAGRVAAGKRLVEWNRKNKADLVKNKGQVDSSDEPSVQVPTSPEPSRTTFYGGGALAILVGVGLFALYLHRGKKPTLVAHPIKSDDDIFCMN